jgi:hypothetical protein
MDGDGTLQRMLTSLRETIGGRMPSGRLSSSADTRLQRTLNHYVREVVRVSGTMDEREILRETFDSMASWFRRNTSQIENSTLAPVLTEQVSTDAEQDPIALFERIRAQRGDPAPAPPTGLRELQPIETRAAKPTPVQQKDVLQRQEDIIKYREVEYNVVLNSKDRDWLHSTGENRYNFSIQLDSGSRPQGSGLQATIQTRFRNIVRIEFVKAILPVEGLDVIAPIDCTQEGSPTTPESAFYSVLALPYVNVVLDEIQGNNVGTNDTIDKSLAICQYDATWRSDIQHGRKNMNRGYTLFFPKFMKAQRVYAPTPLGNLQKMSFQILGPENQLLSKTPDSAAVKRIVFSNDVSGSPCYQDDSGNYLYIETKEWFPMWAFSQLDRIKFDGLSFTSPSASIQSAGLSMFRWLQRIEGHAIVGTAYTTTAGDGTPVISADFNECGYANWIIIRNRFTDPASTGACTLDYFTGSAVSEASLATELRDYPGAYQNGGMLNLSRQVQLVLRIITRELDSATNVRPDNV